MPSTSIPYYRYNINESATVFIEGIAFDLSYTHFALVWILYWNKPVFVFALWWPDLMLLFWFQLASQVKWPCANCMYSFHLCTQRQGCLLPIELYCTNFSCFLLHLQSKNNPTFWFRLYLLSLWKIAGDIGRLFNCSRTKFEAIFVNLCVFLLDNFRAFVLEHSSLSNDFFMLDFCVISIFLNPKWILLITWDIVV